MLAMLEASKKSNLFIISPSEAGTKHARNLIGNIRRTPQPIELD